MSPRPQTHLRELVDSYGEAAGSRFIVDLLEAGLAEKQKAKDEQRAIEKQGVKPNPYFTDALKCERAIYFRLTGEPETEPLTTDSLINFEVGHAIEEAFATMLSYPGVQMLREQSMEFSINGVRISGRLDFLLLLLQESILVELKAINSRSLGFMLKRQMPGRDEHRHQINLYLHGSQQGLLQRKTDVDGNRLLVPVVEKFDLGYLVYVVRDATKGEPPIHAFPVRYDKQMAEGDLEFLAQISHRADARNDPGIPVGFEKKKFPCSYCSWKGRCWD